MALHSPLGPLALDATVDEVKAAIEALGGSHDAAAGATQRGITALGVRRDADTIGVVDGDLAMLAVDEEGRLKVAGKTASFTAVTGTANAVAAQVAADVRRASNVVLHVKNTGTVAMSAGAFAFEASVDSTNGTDGTWFAIQACRSNANTIETASGTLSLAVGAGLGWSWEASVNAYAWVRVRCTTAVTASSIATWTIQRGSYATEPVPAIQTHPVTLALGAARVGFTAASGIWYDATSTTLAASATYTGTSRDAINVATGGTFNSASAYAKEYRVSASSDVAGTLYLEISRDGSTWRRIKSAALAQASGTGTVFYGELVHAPSTRYVRAVFINGAAAQTHFAVQEAPARRLTTHHPSEEPTIPTTE